jgi:DNA-binding LytR/AlgR family response regulator
MVDHRLHLERRVSQPFRRQSQRKFVKGTVLHSTLRDLHTHLTSPRLWATFMVVVAIFVTTGPFGTMESLGLAQRAAFWTLIHATAWATAIVTITIIDRVMIGRFSGERLRLLLAAVAAAPLVALAVELVRCSWFGDIPTLAAYATQVLYSLPLCILFSLLSYMTAPRVAAATPHSADPLSLNAPSPGDAAERDIPLLRRLKPENRGPIVHLTVEDHYTVVTTTRGRQLVLLRFSDALREIGASDGVQTHRSHWVATDHVERWARSNGRFVVRLKTGTEVPVSRGYSESVRLRFGAN